MPWAPKKPCAWPGCHELTLVGRCDKHKRQEQSKYNKSRGGSTKQGYNYKWQQARVKYLAMHPLCVECRVNGRIVRSVIVDHIVPHKGNDALFWDEGNWQALCASCHSRKTVGDGRWGVGKNAGGIAF